MATPRQIRDIFTPVLAEYPDLVMHRRWIIKPPVGLAIIGLHIGQTAYASRSDLALSVVALSRFMLPKAPGYQRYLHVSRNLSEISTGVHPHTLGDAAPDICHDMFSPDYKAYLPANFATKVRPFFDSVRSFDDVRLWISDFRNLPQRQGAPETIDSWIAAMHGDFSTAAELMHRLLDRLGPARDGPAGDQRRFEHEIHRILRTGNRAAIAAFLHDLERRTIAAHGLERYWQPAPFPFERE